VSAAPVPASVVPSKRHRFPAEIISHCVGCHLRFGLSLLDGGGHSFLDASFPRPHRYEHRQPVAFRRE
jgi:hypothetical protein